MSDNKHLVYIGNGRMAVPSELYVAMVRPDKIAIVLDGPNLFLHRAGLPEFLATKYRLRDTARVLLGWKSGANAIAWLISSEAGSFQYAHNLPSHYDDVYHIVNYDPDYYLMPAADMKPGNVQSEQKCREKSWSSIKDYHEHLPPVSQEKSAQMVSQWLSTDIFKPMGATSFLEVGCGAGRNLLFLSRAIEGVRLYGIDINPAAIDIVRGQIPDQADHFKVQSLYDLKMFGDGSVDVVYTSGVLMHVPHGKVKEVVAEMNRIARIAVVHFELHGPSHGFDYHRYPPRLSQASRGDGPGQRAVLRNFPARRLPVDGHGRYAPCSARREEAGLEKVIKPVNRFMPAREILDTVKPLCHLVEPIA